MENREYLIQSVRNALRILRLFSAERSELGITEIASDLSLSKSTAHRLVTALVQKGYLEKNEQNDRYLLGWALLGLSGIITTHLEIHREALPILNHLVEQLGEAIHIGVLEGQEIVYLHKVECKHPVRLQSNIGKRNPAFCSSAGKVILAFQGKEVIESVLQSKLLPYGPNTITDPAKLLHCFEEIKQLGYSLAIEELHEGVTSLAVPVRDYSGEVIAAISVVGPKERMPERKFPFYIENLKRAAEELSNQLGYI
ncbi:IclR family transcriptional regulator [Ammoniphilus sp. 3BR4]|uniref:IclR family transcriptional regulator n=1 Tax=Ammoniphilus sp. 3BR4 TaxID=3158265 RepID=UPI003465668F